MEATGVYWRPIWYVLEEVPGLEVLLVNTRNMRIVPGRKTDVSDAGWIAHLLRLAWSGEFRSAACDPGAS